MYATPRLPAMYGLLRPPTLSPTAMAPRVQIQGRHAALVGERTVGRLRGGRHFTTRIPEGSRGEAHGRQRRRERRIPDDAQSSARVGTRTGRGGEALRVVAGAECGEADDSVRGRGATSRE